MRAVVMIFGLLWRYSAGCAVVKVSIGETESLFRQLTLAEQSLIPDYKDSGRAIYVEESPTNPMFLYHNSNDLGVGRWKISKMVQRDLDLLENDPNTMAYIDSWAVTPYSLDLSVGNSKNRWYLGGGLGGGQISVSITCDSDTIDTSVYFDSCARLRPELTGFYVQRIAKDEDVVYTLVKKFNTDKPMYLFELHYPIGCSGVECTRSNWLIGETYGQDSCLAYAAPRAGAPDVLGRRLPSPTIEWNLVSPFVEDDYAWQIADRVSMYSSDVQFETQSGHPLDGSSSSRSEENVIQFSTTLEVVRFAHSLKSVPSGQRFLRMSHGVPVPQLGLGTGGIFVEQALEVFTSAVRMGYRLFDLAREYGNEHIIKQLINKRPNGVDRSELFLETKVWPTQLGFGPTTRAISTSLRELGVTYIDLYLLHWARCDPNIEWMHCWTTEDANGTWRESWRALEKAFAEGTLMGIGVSNFDYHLLEELRDMATVLPHAVQNHAEPGRVDLSVRAWCNAFGTLYQPYAPLRNLSFLPPQTRQALERVAEKHSVSIHLAALRFFVQTGAQVIPRSTSNDHLQDNAKLFGWELDADDMIQLGWEADKV
mmetsp:Transcript_7984/g.13258  ORF Transcript_7984/g.13258 Transcript_7984/m.13258 type:complete len:595 (-) Transcript_7984:75-1859(-)